MAQLKSLITELTLRQRILILAAVLMVGGAIFGMFRWQHETDFQSLYKALAPEDAAAVVQKLKESGVEYRLSDGGTVVSVPSRSVDEMRLELAGAGLPKSGRIGFELFDKTNFGVTDFAEHVNYRRALEGEIERTIMAISEVEQARVHLTFPKESVYLEERQPAKASVLLRLRPGVRIASQNVLAVAQLVSSAVEGLSPDSVSIVDMNGNLLNRPKRTGMSGDAETSEGALEYQQKVEHDLLVKINSTLEPLLGADKFHAGVSADCDFTGGEQSEELFDPSKSVMVSSQKTEDLSGMGLAGGIPGTASGLPHPASRPSSSSTGISRRSENVSYETSRVVRHTRLEQGAIKKLSVAVLLDQNVHWQGQGSHMQKVLVPPSPERVSAIHDLIAGVIGITPERGDKLIVESLPFETTVNAEPPLASRPAAPPKKSGILEEINRNFRLVVLGAAAVLLLLVVTPMMFFRRGASRPERVRADLPPALLPPLDTEPESPEVPDRIELQQPAPRTKSLQPPVAEQFHTHDIAATKVDALATHLRDAVTKDADLCAAILRGWLKEERS